MALAAVKAMCRAMPATPGVKAEKASPATGKTSHRHLKANAVTTVRYPAASVAWVRTVNASAAVAAVVRHLRTAARVHLTPVAAQAAAVRQAAVVVVTAVRQAAAFRVPAAQAAWASFPKKAMLNVQNGSVRSSKSPLADLTKHCRKNRMKYQPLAAAPKASVKDRKVLVAVVSVSASRAAAAVVVAVPAVTIVVVAVRFPSPTMASPVNHLLLE